MVEFRINTGHFNIFLTSFKRQLFLASDQARSRFSCFIFPECLHLILKPWLILINENQILVLIGHLGLLIAQKGRIHHL
jgi:hypothetical protein